MGIVRLWSNLHRGLRLLRRIAAKKPAVDLDKVVEDAIVQADDLAGRIDKAEKAHSNAHAQLQKHIDKRFAAVQRDLAGAMTSAEKAQHRLGERLLDQGAEQNQRTESIHKAMQTQVFSLAQQINDVNTQLAALREYTVKQQEQARRLQDGYDWSIVKNLCRRIIQCIDDMDRRLQAICESEAGGDDLAMFRDELIFTLDGSGIERFAPEVGQEYRGLESTVEVVGKQPGTSPEQVGRIAEVVRSGYRCYIDPETTRLVRPAQVKVFARAEGGNGNE